MLKNSPKYINTSLKANQTSAVFRNDIIHSTSDEPSPGHRAVEPHFSEGGTFVVPLHLSHTGQSQRVLQFGLQIQRTHLISDRLCYPSCTAEKKEQDFNKHKK